MYMMISISIVILVNAGIVVIIVWKIPESCLSLVKSLKALPILKALMIVNLDDPLPLLLPRAIRDPIVMMKSKMFHPSRK